MTVSERKRVYQTKQRMNCAKRIGQLRPRWSGAEYQFGRNTHVCRSIEDRRQDYARLTHAYLLKIDLDLDK